MDQEDYHPTVPLNLSIVINVESIFINSVNVSFTTTNDHSKWAVTPPSDTKNWICVGDINRAEHQTVRGGGTVCMNSKKVATNYKKCVQTTENCNKTTHH
ncbi:hypothetical protein NQ318_006381 [Aromia moschata]|uniref:Uncharacterized protein n=1 Tax=Aromia moschata TaxID=1265417 RepID=A0AAV8YKC8_9CUCU|nr:hypothetical protein NQ318_006381 [Aromia moschata]